MGKSSRFQVRSLPDNKHHIWIPDKSDIVPGLPTNPRLGVSRGRLTLSGDDVRKIFEPVVHEVNKLVMDQVRATSQAVKKPKAVVMVGGFGQNAYLRDCLREVLASSAIEVLQCPNGYVPISHNTCRPHADIISWTAVVRGALMKGLATSSLKFASVNISGRCARKHYGLNDSIEFIKGIHVEQFR